jgi:hypothetical protein
MTLSGPPPAPGETRSERCAQCGRFKPASAGNLCARCSAAGQRAAKDPIEAWISSAPTDAERAVRLRRAREDFVVARPSELHSGIRVPWPPPPAHGPRADSENAPRRARHSAIRTAALSAVLILAGVVLAAAIPLVLSLLGS